MTDTSDSTCIVCGSTDLRPIYDGTLTKCANCTHARANIRVDKSVLQRVYGTDYFFGQEYVDYLKEKATLQTNFSQRLQKLSATHDFEKGDRVLEIGCAFGFFGEVLTATFPEVEYIGLDISPEACDYAVEQLGLNVKCIDFLDYSDLPRCKHVFMWDVIEHLSEPQQYLAKASSVLEKGGHIYITTGDMSALLPRLQKQNWRMIHPPSHLHYFSRKSLVLLLQNCGFKIVNVAYPPVSRSLRQIYYRSFLLNKRPHPVKQAIYRHIPDQIGISLNTFDIMLVVAEKQ